MRSMAVIFDLDGTLLDSREAFVRQNMALLSRAGVSSPSRSMGEELLGFQLEELLARLNMPGKDIVEEIDREYVETFMKKYASPFPGVLGCLKRLRSKAKVAIATNTSKLVLGEALSAFGLDQCVDVAVSAAEVGKQKPEPELLLKAAHLLGVEPSRCVYVGDTLGDVLAAKRAGMISFAVLQGGISKEEDMLAGKPDALFWSVVDTCSSMLFSERG